MQTSSSGKTQSRRLDHLLPIGVALSMGLSFAGALSPAVAQDRISAHRSIHAMESEAHRDLVIKPVSGRFRLAPLPPAAPSSLTHTVFGFYPYWAPGYSQIRFQDITHLAVFSVEADGAGRLVNLRGWPNGPLIELAHRNGVRVVLVCTLFNADQLQSLLSSSAARQSLINNLREQVVRGGADGVNIDFEGVSGNQRANLVAFMQDLAAAIRSAVPGAHISIDTPAVDWSNAFDVAALADICDALMIMAYDYHWSTSANAGPVAPLESSTFWGKYSVRATIADYLTKAGAARSFRLLLGVPYYGLDWPTQSESLNALTLAPATARIYTEASQSSTIYGRRWDNLSLTPWYAYSAQTIRQVWYDDAQSLALKYNLVFQYNLQGIGIWALTYDRDTTDLWKLIENRFVVPPPLEPPDLLAPALFFDSSGLPVALKEKGTVRAAGFELAVGSTPGGRDVRDFTGVGLKRQVFLQGLSLESGKTYYVTARSLGAGGVTSAPGSPAAIRIDTTRAPERLFMPHWAVNDDLYTGLALVNAAAEARAVLMLGHRIGREPLLRGAWVLAPGQQMAALLSEPDLLGTDAKGGEGWLELLYLGEAWPSMFLVGDNLVSRMLDGGRLATAAPTQIIPELDGGQAQLSIVNPGSGTAQVLMKLVRPDGSSADRKQELASGAVLTRRVLDLFPDFRAGGKLAAEASTACTPAAYLQIESDRAVVCSSTLQHGNDTAEIPGLDTKRTATSGAFSYAPLGGGFRSRAVFVNPSSEAQSLEIRLIAASAANWLPVAIPAYSAMTADLAEILGRGDSDRGGAVEVRVIRGGGVLGALWIRSEDDKVMTAMPLESVTSAAYIFPQLVQAQGYWTGVSLANPGAIAAEIDVLAFDAAGSPVGSFKTRLNAGEARAGLLFEWIRETLGLVSGRLEVRSTGPVLAVQILGSDRLSFIAAVPGR